MLDQVLQTFDVVPDYDLNIMKERQTLFDITTNILNGIKEVLEKEKPDVVLVHGDTSTTFVTALACFYLQIPIGHGKVVADIANRTGKYSDIAFLDDDTSIAVVGRYLCEGTIEKLRAESKQTEVFVAIGNAKIRKRILEKVEAEGFMVSVLVHPNAVLGEDVELGRGSVVMAGAVINSGTKLGKGVIINTCIL